MSPWREGGGCCKQNADFTGPPPLSRRFDCTTPTQHHDAAPAPSPHTTALFEDALALDPGWEASHFSYGAFLDALYADAKARAAAKAAGGGARGGGDRTVRIGLRERGGDPHLGAAMCQCAH